MYTQILPCFTLKTSVVQRQGILPVASFLSDYYMENPLQAKSSRDEWFISDVVNKKKVFTGICLHLTSFISHESEPQPICHLLLQIIIPLHTPLMGGILSGGSRWSRKKLSECEPKNVAQRGWIILWYVLNVPPFFFNGGISTTFSVVANWVTPELKRFIPSDVSVFLPRKCKNQAFFLALHVYIGGHVDQKPEYL